MAEYIEREALIAEYDRVHVGPPGGARKLMVDAPAADVAPVVHGRWVNEQMVVGGFAETWACDCSVCGRTQREPLWKPNYCPNCGAHMKEGGAE